MNTVKTQNVKSIRSMFGSQFLLFLNFQQVTSLFGDSTSLTPNEENVSFIS